MTAPARISEARFVRACRPCDPDDGLVAWVSCRYGVLHLDGLAIRRTNDGNLTVTYPTRRDHAGRRHRYVAPVDLEARRSIEAQVLAAFKASHWAGGSS